MVGLFKGGLTSRRIFLIFRICYLSLSAKLVDLKNFQLILSKGENWYAGRQQGESICFFLFVQGRQLRGMMTTRRVSGFFFHLSQGRQLKGRQTTRRKCLLFLHSSKGDNWERLRQLGESIKFFSIYPRETTERQEDN